MYLKARYVSNMVPETLQRLVSQGMLAEQGVTPSTAEENKRSRVLYSGNSSEPPLDGLTTCIQRGQTPHTQANSPPGCPTAALGVTECTTP